ncbi:Proteins of 100 residues with WXG [Mycobacteroides abscessus subsp. massiliense]|uniref:WXG100 family type VII secretion target n=1 Tax=Mycobacteroides abscessus TaxID=36809 RepID=UPI00089DB794|nr:hypothetical protein [Mycobacteroides abscessus]SLE55592.1 Proteins of 100 residues with WXG [Mycobacteroides abscessus subsp. massiliense]SLH46483.1 Proteins of 100 residues with WXG [Mycobacteroides abscessus subsp. massiliense]
MYDDALRVDLAELRESAGKLKTTASDLTSAHGAVHSKIADLVTEFGESAGATALRGRLAEWEAETKAHHNEVMSHHGKYVGAEKSYLESDERNKSGIEGL